MVVRVTWPLLRVVIFAMAIKKGIADDFQDCVKGGKVIADHACLPKNYSHNQIPQVPLKIEAGIYILNIPSVDEKARTVTFKLSMRWRWKDTRILLGNGIESSKTPEYNWTQVYGGHEEDIWKPTIIFNGLHSFKEEKAFEPLDYIKIMFYQDDYGDLSPRVLKFARATITVYCPMTFSKYPMDRQKCSFQMGSLNYPNKDLVFYGLVRDDTREYMLEDYNHEIHPKQYDYIGKTTGANYSNFGFDLILERKLSPFIWKYYMPSACCVIMTSMSFLIPPEAIPGRTSLLVTLFLVISGLFNSVQSSLPRSDGLTALSVYIFISQMFIFLALVEYAILLGLIRIGKLPRGRKLEAKFNLSIEAITDLTVFQAYNAFYLLVNIAYFYHYIDNDKENKS